MAAPSPRASAATAALERAQIGVLAWAIAGTGICGALLLAARSSRRSERTASVISAAEKLVLAHTPLRASLGPVLAGGATRVVATARAASGSYAASAVGGAARGWVSLDAVRDGSGSPWVFSALRVDLDVDRGAVARAAAERRALVASWGDGNASTASGAEGGGDAEGAAPVGVEAASFVIVEQPPPLQ